jgi:hypothetical protein
VLNSVPKVKVASVGRTPVTAVSFATFSDPDGNTWQFQEITTRLPGRGLSSLDVSALTELLLETEQHHGEYEPTAPKHHWSEWYAAYIVGATKAVAVINSRIVGNPECAGMNRHVVGNERVLEERRKRLHLGLQSCGEHREVLVEA